jgi:hypothetical protein
VKRLLAVVVGLFGIRALLRRRSHPVVTYGAPSPAEDLKARLAESRGSEPETAAEPTVDEKRVDVHNRARGAIDELKS